MNLNKQEKHILLHTTGLSYLTITEKNKLTEDLTRNYFYTSPDTVDFPVICSLVKKGLMYTTGRSWDGISKYYYATEEGIEIARQIAIA